MSAELGQADRSNVQALCSPPCRKIHRFHLREQGPPLKHLQHPRGRFRFTDRQGQPLLPVPLA